jgi:hypothetical protein
MPVASARLLRVHSRHCFTLRRRCTHVNRPKGLTFRRSCNHDISTWCDARSSALRTRIEHVFGTLKQWMGSTHFLTAGDLRRFTSQNRVDHHVRHAPPSEAIAQPRSSAPYRSPTAEARTRFYTPSPNTVRSSRTVSSERPSDFAASQAQISNRSLQPRQFHTGLRGGHMARTRGASRAASMRRG